MLFLGDARLLLLAYLVSAYANRLESISTVDEYLNICPRGKFQKELPSLEPGLETCKVWRENSCCTIETSIKISNNALHNFDFSHCDGPLSQKCLEFFHHDYCFVECSPNIGPWLVTNDYSSLGSERGYEMPLCQTDCNQWFKACENDMTCAVNWSSGGFNWTTGTNKCREGVECLPIHQVYGTANNFCEHVWDHTWKVVSDAPHTWGGGEPHCMHLTTNNMTAHNHKVARTQAEFIINRVYGVSSGSTSIISAYILYLAAVLIQ